MSKNGKGKLVDIDDLWALERIGGVALSPDGAQAVCSVSRYSMAENKGQTHLWLLSTFGGAPRQLTHCGDKDGQASWSPDGTQIAFVGRREQQGTKDESPQLYLIAPDGGEARRVSHYAPGIEAYKWTPDGKRIVFIAWVWPELEGAKAQSKRQKEFDERKESGYVTSEALYRYWDHHVPMGRVPHLHLLDIASGRVTDLFEGTEFETSRTEQSADQFDISPDGRSIVFAYDPQPEKRIDNCHALVEFDLRARKFATIAEDAQWDLDAPRYSPRGDRIAFVAAHVGKRHTMPGHLALIERSGAKARWQVLSADWDHAVHAPLRWSAQGDAVFFSAEDRARSHLYRYELATRTPDIAVTGGWVQSFDVRADVIVSAADASMHPTRVHATRAGAAPMRLERFNDEAMSRLALGRVEEVSIEGALGEPVQMWITYPPGFDAGGKRKAGKGGNSAKKYPILHSIHGGPHAAAGDTFHYRWNSHLFAAQGYVVAGVNYHGSSGFGHAFLDSITHRWGELELQDVEAATDWLLAQPWADRSRVFAAGGSYGGYMVAWMNGRVQPGRYRAYVCHAGCFDWTAMFADDAYTWHAKEFGVYYWDDPAQIARQSAITHVAQMQTPTLVVHGALDYRVPDQQGLAYYNTLKAKGVDARLLWFPDENHWILKPRNSRLWYREFFDWLARHDLKGKAAKPKRPSARGQRATPSSGS